MKSLREYGRLRPAEANPLDSLGDVNFYLGHFEDAEKFYLQAQAKDPNFANGGSQLKAAYARLMTGDIPGADAIFQKYLDARRSASIRAEDALLEYRQAEWDFMAGRRRRAMDRLLAFAKAMSVSSKGAQFREVVSSAYAQLAIWNIDMGDREQARANALKARATAGPSSAAAAIMAGFVTQSATSESEWKATAQTYFSPNTPMPFRQLSLAYALLFAKQFAAAEPVLKQLYDQSSPTAEQNLPVLLAWSLIETGRWQQAAPLVATNPIPRAAGLDPFSCLAFPRLFFLRGVALEKQGKVDDARRNYALFSKLAGPDPDIFAGR
jgi:tetratricopeptide (TPR) repeat protein